MGLSLERRTILTARSERVKCIDFHPTEPWILASLYSGVLAIWNYETQIMVKSIEVSDMPVRAARFIARKNWIIVGADDLQIRVYNYHTLEKVTQFEGHTDYIRQFAIHPSRPFVLSCSDDMTIRLWDWEKGWKCVSTFEGHTHYVMAIAFNPKDPNIFATASLDRTIKVWSISTLQAHYTMEGHEKGVNCLDYYPGGDRPYLTSGGDDGVVRIWDYQTKTCVRVLEGHTQNITAIIYHGDLPLLFSVSEDGTMRIWNANSFRLESTFNPSLDRLWSVALRRTAGSSNNNEVAIGGDEGSIVFQLGRGEPAASLDVHSGKMIWAHHSEIWTGNVRQSLAGSATDGTDLSDGMALSINRKELGHSDLYPTNIIHSPGGKFAAVLGDGEYVIYSTLAWRNRSFGKGLELVWSSLPSALTTSSDYAVRESPSLLRIFRNFNEVAAIRMTSPCDGLFGGPLVGASCAGGQLCFLDWSLGQVVGRIDVEAHQVYWSPSGSKVTICTSDTIYFLTCDQNLIQKRLQQQQQQPDYPLPEEGIPEAFNVISQIEGWQVGSACWMDENVFVLISAPPSSGRPGSIASSHPGGVANRSGNRLAYIMVGLTETIHQLSLLDRPLALLGYLVEEGKLILVDRESTPYLYSLPQVILNYQAAILQGDTDRAHQLLPQLPSTCLNRVAQFLAAQGQTEEALNLATDEDLRFQLALELRKLDLAFELASKGDSPLQWRQLGELSLKQWKISLAERCFLKCEDLPTLLLVYSSTGNISGLLTVAQQAMERGQLNVAFTAFFIAGRREECFDLLVESERYPEAALFARSYLPSAVDRAVRLWKDYLRGKKHRAAELLADPINRPELFPQYHPHTTTSGGVSSTGGSGSGNGSAYTQKPASRQSFDFNNPPTIPTISTTTNLSTIPSSTSNSASNMANFNSSSSTVPVNSPAYDIAYSDHLSLEVNTGTGSMRADDLDDLASVTISESRDDPLVVASRHLEKLSIQELEEEHRLSSDLEVETETASKGFFYNDVGEERQPPSSNLSSSFKSPNQSLTDDEFAEALVEGDDGVTWGDNVTGDTDNFDYDKNTIMSNGEMKTTSQPSKSTEQASTKTAQSLPPIDFDNGDGWD